MSEGQGDRPAGGQGPEGLEQLAARVRRDLEQLPYPGRRWVAPSRWLCSSNEASHIGRTAERAMLTVTGGVNTHRGALWALGLLCAAIGAGATSTDDATAYAAMLARIRTPNVFHGRTNVPVG